MKVAVSLPDDLFTAADQLARRLKVSRSRLYAAALADYVQRQRADRVTEELNRVYRAADSRLPDDLRRAARKTLERSEW